MDQLGRVPSVPRGLQTNRPHHGGTLASCTPQCHTEQATLLGSVRGPRAATHGQNRGDQPCAGGETEEEILRVDMLENQIMDFRMSLVMVCYNPDFEKLKPGYLEQLPGKLKLFSNFLGDRKWFAGEKLTFVDFLMFDVLDQNRIFEPKCLEPFKNLKDFVERFGALEKVAAYLKSSRFQKMPINNKMAKWGNKKV
nr:glutathione S-transferase Mu 5-like [Zonotrichia albicollis]